MAQNGPGPMPGDLDDAEPGERTRGQGGYAARRCAGRRRAGDHGVDGPHQRRPELALRARDVAVVDQLDLGAGDGVGELVLLGR